MRRFSLLVLFCILALLVFSVPILLAQTTGQPESSSPTWWIAAVTFIVGTILPLVFLYLIPNAKFYAWGVSTGKKMSKAGNKIIGKSYEQLENNITGSFLSFAQGVKEGASTDNQ